MIRSKQPSGMADMWRASMTATEGRSGKWEVGKGGGGDMSEERVRKR